MSYAEMAAKGPKQSDEEKIPHHVPEIAHSDSSVHSLDSQNMSSPNIQSLPSSYADQQSLAEDRERELRDAEDQAKKDAREFADKAEQKGEELKKKAGIVKEKAKKEVKREARYVDENKGNPVFIGNAAVLAGVAGLLGIGAYRKHVAGELTWKVAGAWAGVVGLFAVGDFYVSQYFFKKYPPKN